MPPRVRLLEWRSASSGLGAEAVVWLLGFGAVLGVEPYVYSAGSLSLQSLGCYAVGLLRILDVTLPDRSSAVLHSYRRGDPSGSVYTV